MAKAKAKHDDAADTVLMTGPKTTTGATMSDGTAYTIDNGVVEVAPEHIAEMAPFGFVVDAE